jgi:hypothetical protein
MVRKVSATSSVQRSSRSAARRLPQRKPATSNTVPMAKPGMGPSRGSVSSDQRHDSASGAVPPVPKKAQALKALTVR